MTGGAFRNSSNLLGRRREIEELEGKVGALKEELQKIQKGILDKRERRNALRDKLTEMTRQLQQLQIGQNTEKVGVQAEARIREVRTGYGQLKAEGREIENQIAEIKGSSSLIREEMEQSTTREQEQEALVNSHQEILEQLQEKEAAYSQELNQIQLDYASLEQKVSFAGENLSRIHQEEATMREELQQMQEALEAGDKEKEEKEQGILTIQQTIQEAERIREEDETQMQNYLAKKEELSSQHKTFFSRRDELSAHISRMDKECFRLNSQKEKLEERQENQINYLWEEYEVTPGQANTYRMEEMPERGEIRQQIAELKDAIRKLGNVNVNAIEEYKEILERHTFLNAQHTDLVEAAETLKGIIAELDEGMRKQFTEKFQEIRQEFDKVFKELFGGGQGNAGTDGG